MPSLGADMEAGTLTEWLVKPGDLVKRGDIIAVVETQKGLIDIEVFDEGTISELLIKENEKVPVGTVMALISSDKEVVKKEEVEKAILEKMAPKEEKKIIGTESIRMAVAAAMSKSNREIPHYYLETKVDMSKALAWLTEANKQRTVKQRLLPVVLLLKAVSKALLEVPDLNGYWENGFLQKKDINVGFVVSLRTGGVMIPAIHDADKKSLDEMMASLNDIIPRARAMKLRSSELSESTITVTNLGEGNVETVFGVIYPPQVAIVGFGSIAEQPWADSGMLDVRPVLTVSLAADHRATDGATGSRFLMAIKNYLGKPDLL